MNLADLGWNSFFEENYSLFAGSGLVPARIITREGNVYHAEGTGGPVETTVAGHFSYIAAGQNDYPAAGDWVLLRESSGVYVIERVLERKSRFSRRTAGRQHRQLQAACQFLLSVQSPARVWKNLPCLPAGA